MVANRLPSDAMMALWREEGLLLCTCTRPTPWPRQVWGERECRLCAKLILGKGGVELLRRRAELAAAGKIPL